MCSPVGDFQNAVAEATLKHVIKRVRPPYKGPGTVQSFTSGTGDAPDVCSVWMDGDPAGHYVDVMTLVACAAGDRVVVEGRKGGVSYVTGVA